MLMQPSNQSFHEMLGNGSIYKVPKFQRDYSWTLEQLEDLWQDIQSLGKDEYHYMGYLVLQQTEGGTLEIIDGQQRLTTLSIFILAAINKLQNLINTNEEKTNNQQRLDILRTSYIGAINPISLKVDGKLTLNRNNKESYQYLSKHLEPKNIRGLTKTNKLLQDTFHFFNRQFYGNCGQEIMEFVEASTKHLVFTKIIVQDSINAYKVFETLNARGVQLSIPDLIKNYLFSTIAKDSNASQEDFNDLDDSWGNIIEQLGESNFTDYVRYQYNSTYALTTKNSLFKSIRGKINTSKQAYQYFHDLEFYAPIYAALQKPEDSFWANQEDDYRDAKEYLMGLKTVQIKQPFVVLMVAFKKFSAKEFILTAKYLYAFSIRYNIICHHSAKEQEKVYATLANKITSGEITRASHLKNTQEFKALYPKDDAFLSVFDHHKMPSRSSSAKIRLLLSQIEQHLGFSRDFKKIVLEHICPYHPSQEWHEQFGEGASDVQDRLGNLILLAADDLKTISFEKKKEHYLKDASPLVKKIASYKEWNMENVNAYQRWLGKQAIQTWRIDWE